MLLYCHGIMLGNIERYVRTTLDTTYTPQYRKEVYTAQQPVTNLNQN